MSELWVGGRKDSVMVWVFDSSMKHPDDSMVYLFNVKNNKMKDYEKSFARKKLFKLVDERVADAEQSYLLWKEQFGNDFLKTDRERAITAYEVKKIEKAKEEHKSKLAFEKLLLEAKENHKDNVLSTGRNYGGTSVCHEKHRAPYCYNCKVKSAGVHHRQYMQTSLKKLEISISH